MNKTNIAYLIGALQTDGYIYKYKRKDRTSHRLSHRLKINGCPKSKPMVEKVRDILSSEFGRNVKIHKRKNQNAFYLHTTVKELLSTFEKFEINDETPPPPPLMDRS